MRVAVCEKHGGVNFYPTLLFMSSVALFPSILLFFLLFVLCFTWLYPLFFISSFPPSSFLPFFLLSALFLSLLLPHDIFFLSFFHFRLFYYLSFLLAVFFINFWLFSTRILPSIYTYVCMYVCVCMCVCVCVYIYIYIRIYVSFLLSFFILFFLSDSMTYSSPRGHMGLIHANTPCPASELEGTKEYDSNA